MMPVVYLLVAVPAILLVLRQWLRQRAQERAEGEELAAFLEERRHVR